jgi:predicted phage tail protein
MQHSVYLQGELGERFGSKFIVNTNDYADVFKCINANRPEFLPYVRKCHEEDINFIVETEDGTIDQTDLIVPICKGDITISLAPAGSKSGIAKILAAIAIIAIIAITGGFAGLGTGVVGAAGPMQVGWAVGAAGGLSTAGSMVALLSINLALAGMQQMMAPDPAVDADAPTNYIFSGGANTSIEGDPIPVLYGELRVPGRPIAVDIRQGGNGSGGTQTIQDAINNVTPDAAGNINIVAPKQQP